MVSESQRAPATRKHERRLDRTPFRFPERRSGFERREIDGWRGRYQAELRRYADRPSTLLLVLATIVVFNFMDLYLTARVLDAGGSELNPIMEHLFSLGPMAAAMAKLGVVGFAVLILLALRRYRRTLEVSLLLLVSYSFLMLYHVVLALRIAAS
jgi:Domain of unknown function (DUF5658)